MHFLDLLKKFMAEKCIVNITFGDKFSLNCRIVEAYGDFIKVNLMSFNKTERAFNPTPSYYFIPLNAVVFIEEPRQK